MSELRLYLLGTPRIEIDGGKVRLSRRKGLALLAYLAVTGEAQRRDTLAALFWPESAQSKARAALRVELSVLRKALSAEWLVIDREHVDLNRAAEFWLDVQSFREILTSQDNDRPDMGKLESALALYRGDFLSGFTLSDAPLFDEWQFFEADAYRLKLFTALDTLVAIYRQQGEIEKALGHARRRLALDQLFEPGHRSLMELYVLAGQRTAALRQYRECIRTLDEEMGVRPHEETTALHVAIRSRHFPGNDRAKLLSHSVVPTPPHNLLPQTTSFIGREREVEEVLARLAVSENRLVTITGTGGIGKTRLGLAVAESILTNFAEGVWYVPLANVDRAEIVPITIAATLSVPVGNADVRSSLFGFLREKHLLLVLDNFEHLVDGADFLSELLLQAPQVKLLVTSQERLNLLEESVYPLAGLSTPQDDSSASDAYPALALFDQVARRVKPDFSLEDERMDVTAICRTAEGMPLAIELAAGWVRMISCKEIAAEIKRDGDFLSTTLRNLPARHRSLHALFERSWSLLSAEEQGVVRRLSVFRDGFDRNGAMAVAEATPMMLVSLIDRSLIRRQAGDRFDMHGLLHRFASEKLAADAAEGEWTRSRHADCYADLVAQAGWELEPGDEAAGVALENEAANFLDAWRWGVEKRDASVVRRMMRWLLDYFRRQGDYSGGEAAFDSAVRAFRSDSEGAQDAGLLGSLLLRLGKSASFTQPEATTSPAHEAVTLLRRAQPRDPLELAQALVKLGMIYANLGRNQEGAELLGEAVALFEEAGNELGVGATLRDWGWLEKGGGRLRQAQRVLEESVQVLEGRDRKSHAQSMFALATMLTMRGHYSQAEALIQHTLPLFAEQGEEVMTGWALCNLGDLYTATGDFAGAERCYTGAYARFEPFGLANEVTTGFCLPPGVLARLRGDADAETRLVDALAIARQVGFSQHIATNLHHLACLHHDERDDEGALALLDEALLISRKIDFRYATALIIARRGHCLLALQRTDAARAAFTKALEISEREGLDRISCDALTGVAQLMVEEGDTEQAVVLLTFAEAYEASEWETKERARQALAELEERLPADVFLAAQERGRETDLTEAVSGALQWLAVEEK